MLVSCKPSGGSWQHYRLSAFDEARNRGMPMAIHFHEPKNQTCEEQKNSLEKVIKQEKFKSMGAYRVTFGTEKPLEKAFKIESPCTLLVFKGFDEKSRALGATDERLLEKILDQAL